MLPKINPPLLGVVSGSANALLASAAGDSPSVVFTLATLAGTAVCALAYVLRYVISKMIPAMQKEHRESITALCASFERNGDKDRSILAAQHKELAGAVAKVSELAREILEKKPRGSL